MRYKAFGKTGLEVSELCLGTWGIGGAGWDQNPEETKMDAIRASFEQGTMRARRSGSWARHSRRWAFGRT